jgi:predicted unusual protein kinase regulating ubiquinone biosynthesis (AarF/ABC1/UbiB family)
MASRALFFVRPAGAAVLYTSAFGARAVALAVTQTLLGRRRRRLALQAVLALAAKRLLGRAAAALLGPFLGPQLALWAYGFAARVFAPDHWRNLQFWREVAPIYAGYKKTQAAVAHVKSEDMRAKKWAKRHEWGARKVYDMCVSLRGYHVKNGQYLGSRGDLVPPQWCEALTELQDHVPPVSWVEVCATIRSSYVINRPEQLFARIDKTPLASGTIAQVHRATLLSGEPVVVKAQYCDQERLFLMDLRNLKRLATWLQNHDMQFIDMASITGELDAQMPREFNFELEAESMMLIRDNLVAARMKDVIVPRVVPGLVSRRALTMEFVSGVRPDNLVALKLWGIKPESVVETVGRAIGQMLLVDGFFHADTHCGNLLVQRDGRVALIDFGQCKQVPEALRSKLCAFYLAVRGRQSGRLAETFAALGIDLAVPAEVERYGGAAAALCQRIAGHGAAAGTHSAVAVRGGLSAAHDANQAHAARAVHDSAVHGADAGAV